MDRRALTLTAAVIAAAAATSMVACAHADPGTEPPSAPAGPPQLDAACSTSLDGALTALPPQPGDPSNRKNLLECSSGAWRTFTGEYPSSDRWLSTGPDVVLRGQGIRNPEIMGGTWTATPQTEDAQCRAQSVDAEPGGTSGEAEISTADPGQPVTVDVSDHLLTVTLSGYCLWQRDD